MDYIALARHYRPQTFEKLIGQPLVITALTNSLNQQTPHHAYLFTGTRGVGKTSLARLLAKALNCEQGISATPCLVCDTCRSIEQGASADLFEIDGASKTKVEDIRDLLENAQYAPINARFKIYLIDEVHMLSQHSFNALLKTLEEPPSHLKFLLATTDPQKIPATILSRCIQFHLKPIPQTTIFAHLKHILQDQNYTASDDAITLIANAAEGSLRDGLTILEQAIACATNQTIDEKTTRAMLGLTQIDYTHQILTALAEKNAEQLLAISQSIQKEGEHFEHVLEQLLHAFHQLACFKHLPPQSPWITCPPTLQPLADAFLPETLQLLYQITLKSQADFTLAPSKMLGFEMTLLRLLAYQPALEKKAPRGIEQVPPPKANDSSPHNRKSA